MFTKLANEIDFNDIEAFCREWAEGVRVEYKSEIAHIPKIISSFANTQGGIFIIGVETDQNNKVKFPIQGIPNEGGTKERIIQSALTGIYPAVMPEVIIRDVPGETNRVVVVVRVEESQQAPHAIQNSTKVYIREGSITQPYELAAIGRIEHLLKRREEPQRISQHILDRIEERVLNHCSHLELPNLELIARPVFPYRPLISPSEIYEFMSVHTLVPFAEADNDIGTRNVAGGVCFMGARSRLTYWELNEYGIIYERETLSREPWRNNGRSGNESRGTRMHLNADDIASRVFDFLWLAKDFFEKCEYSGNIEITIRMREVDKETLKFKPDRHPGILEERKSVESEVSASNQCLPHDLNKVDANTKILIGLLGQLFWAFNVRENEGQWWDERRKYVEERVGK